MTTLRAIRAFFLFLSVVSGYFFVPLLLAGNSQAPIIGAASGFVFAVILILLEIKLRSVSLRNLSAGVFGLIFGFFIAWILTLILRLIPMDEIAYAVFQVAFTLVFCYLGMTISMKGKDEFNLVIPYVRFSREDRREQMFILDTSVIIDGRIARICETGFLDGKLIVPRFIIQELQQVADSADDSKRSRGRRGLDILNMLKTLPNVEVIVHDESLANVKEVDAKLVRLAKILDCRVITNDFNLNKVAKIEGVIVMNVNDLANALRLVIFPGEEMSVYIRKEGKEKNQGVAFMDDGTMIVVDNARRLLGKQAKVSVTSVLQTSAGRMIFASLMEREGTENGQSPSDQRDRSRDQRNRSHSQRDRNRPHEQRDRSHEQRDRSHEQRDRSHEQRDRSHEQRDRSQEQSDRPQEQSDRPQEQGDRPQEQGDRPQEQNGQGA